MGSYSSAQSFIPTAAQAGLKEIELSRLALTKARNAEVKSFARMMVSDHSKNHQELQTLAFSKNITIPGTTSMGASGTIGNASGSGTTDNTAGAQGKNNTGTNPDNTTGSGNNPGTTGTMWNAPSLAADLASLQNLSGSEFDRRYIALMVQDHEQAVALFTGASQSSDSQVKAYAVKSLPVLKSHLASARRINNKLNQ